MYSRIDIYNYNYLYNRVFFFCLNIELNLLCLNDDFNIIDYKSPIKVLSMQNTEIPKQNFKMLS